MLNFLNSAVLALAATALLPFLLHLFSRRKVKVVPFSSIAFLKAMQKRQVRSIKIRQLLLLIVRTLIILAVVMAFARPATRGGQVGAHASVSAVILVDNSASMGLSVRDGRLFDLAIKKTRDILGRMGQSDEVAVMATCGETAKAGQENLFVNPMAAGALLDKIVLTDQRADLAEAYNRAASRLESRLNLNRELYFVSDFQDNCLDPDKIKPTQRVRTFLVGLPGDRIDNVGIAEIDFGNQLIEVGTEFAVTATVVRRQGAEDETLVSLYLDDRRVAQQGRRLKPGESVGVIFGLAVGEPGFHSGYFQISDDDLLADNICHFAFYIPEQFDVLVVGPEAISRRLFRLALAPDETLRRHWTVEECDWNRFAAVDLNRFDAVFMVNYTRLTEADLARVKEYVRRGGGLLLNLGQEVDVDHYNRSLADITGVAASAPFPREFSRSGYYVMTDFEFDHPILSVFKQSGRTAQPDIKAYAMLKSRVVEKSAARILSRWSDGSPALATAVHGRGRVMFFNAESAPEVSDLTLHPFFVPLVVRSAEYLSGAFSIHAEAIHANQAVTRSLVGRPDISPEFSLHAPDSGRTFVSGRWQDDRVVIDCGQVAASGIYSLLGENGEVDRFAVNVAAPEGDLYRRDWDKMTHDIAGAESMPYEADLAALISEKRFGRELWHYFLAGALVLLALEMALARDRGNIPEEES